MYRSIHPYPFMFVVFQLASCSDWNGIEIEKEDRVIPLFVINTTVSRQYAYLQIYESINL